MPSVLRIFSLALTSKALFGQSETIVRKDVDAWGEITDSFLQLGEQPQMSAKVQAVLREFEELAHSGKAPDKEKINTIKEIVDEELLPDLVATHASAQKQRDINLGAVETCNANSHKRLATIKGSDEATVGELRTAHKTCRELEKTKNRTKVDACAELDTFLEDIIIPEQLPANRERSAMVQYVKEMSKYYCPKGPRVDELDEACEAAVSGHATQKHGCDTKQHSFENGFCTWRAELTDACKALDTCWKDAKKTYGDFVNTTSTLVARWKVEYKALKKISCYIQVWLSDNNVNTVDNSKFEECESKPIDDSPMNIEFKDAAPQAECPLTAVQKYPGTNDFRSSEYGNFLDYVDEVVSCL